MEVISPYLLRYSIRSIEFRTSSAKMPKMITDKRGMCFPLRLGPSEALIKWSVMEKNCVAAIMPGKCILNRNLALLISAYFFPINAYWRLKIE